MKKVTVKGSIKVLGIDLAKQSFHLHGVDGPLLFSEEPSFLQESGYAVTDGMDQRFEFIDVGRFTR